MKTGRFLILVALMGLLVFSSTGWASGSYPPAITSPQSGGSLDREKYHKGKKIFLGQLDKKQREGEKIGIAALKALVKKLPRRVKEKLDVGKLAEKLTKDHFESLKYYLSVRFKISL